MAATLVEILDAVEPPLDALPNLRTSTVIGPDLPVTGNASVAVVMTPDIPSYRSTMRRGVYELELQILLLTSAVVDREGQRKLARYASQTGEHSVRAALEADPTFGGIAQTSYLDSFTVLGIEQVGVIGYFGGMFRLKIALSGA